MDLNPEENQVEEAETKHQIAEIQKSEKIGENND